MAADMSKSLHGKWGIFIYLGNVKGNVALAQARLLGRGDFQENAAIR